MRLKAIAATGLAVCAVGGVFAAGATATPGILNPSQAELAEHPGMVVAVTCDVTPAQEEWLSEHPHGHLSLSEAEASAECDSSWVPNAGSAQATTSKHRVKHRAKHRSAANANARASN